MMTKTTTTMANANTLLTTLHAVMPEQYLLPQQHATTPRIFKNMFLPWHVHWRKYVIAEDEKEKLDQLQTFQTSEIVLAEDDKRHDARKSCHNACSLL